MVNISDYSEMVELEAFVELSWNDPLFTFALFLSNKKLPVLLSEYDHLMMISGITEFQWT